MKKVVQFTRDEVRQIVERYIAANSNDDVDYSDLTHEWNHEFETDPEEVMISVSYEHEGELEVDEVQSYSESVSVDKSTSVVEEEADEDEPMTVKKFQTGFISPF